jgi:hypothetical protein
MRLVHIVSFIILGASVFLAFVALLNRQYDLTFAYFVAACSWVIVACYEYNERVFERAIQEIVRRQFTKPPSEE